MENCHDAIIDHCSFSWANEECAALYDTKNTTVQWNIVSEGLYNANHHKGVRSYCGVWGGQYATYHHNLIANHNSRTARFDGARAHDTVALIDYRNNVIYNWANSNGCYGGEVEIPGGMANTNMINNYYKPGPATSTTLKFVRPDYAAATATGIGRWHVRGNVMIGDTAKTNNNWKGVDFVNIPTASQAYAKSDTAFYIADSIATQSAQNAYDSVLAKAGAIYPVRDSTDIRILHETSTGTALGLGTFGKYGIIDTPKAVGGWAVYNTYNVYADTDHDGMPDLWETTNGLDPNNPNDRNDTLSNGYTQLEIYLNSIPVSYLLPLRLISFLAKYTNSGNVLKWRIEDMQRVAKSFAVEKSYDGQHFAEIKTMPSTTGNEYAFTDKEKRLTKVYYRIKVMERDGIISTHPYKH